MSKLQYFNYPGWGKQARELHNLSQVVRIGNELRISGQGGRRGWDAEMKFSDNEAEQIEQAWKNVETALKDAGLKNPFDNIFSVRSYHVNKHYDTAEMFSGITKKLFKNHAPIWTLIGVDRLALPEMKIEIEVCAVVDD